MGAHSELGESPKKSTLPAMEKKIWLENWLETKSECEIPKRDVVYEWGLIGKSHRGQIPIWMRCRSGSSSESGVEKGVFRLAVGHRWDCSRLVGHVWSPQSGRTKKTIPLPRIGR